VAEAAAAVEEEFDIKILTQTIMWPVAIISGLE
jgi:hypothetical protein